MEAKTRGRREGRETQKGTRTRRAEEEEEEKDEMR